MVRRVSSLPQGIEALVADSERANFKFVRKLVDEWAAGTNRFARDGEALFTASENDTLLGV